MRKIHIWVLASFSIIWSMGCPIVHGSERGSPAKPPKSERKLVTDGPVRDDLLDLDLSKNIQQYPENLQEDIRRLNSYVNTLRWISKEDRKDLKQEGLIGILERAKKGLRTNVKFAVSNLLREFLKHRKLRSLDEMRYDLRDPSNEYPEGLVNWVLEMRPNERKQYLDLLTIMEADAPNRLGDLIAYTARTKVFKNATVGEKEMPDVLFEKQEDFIKSFEYRYPKAVQYALESLSVEQNTLSHRVRYHFRENWKWWLTAVGVAFVAYLVWRFGRGSDPNMVMSKPHSPSPTSRPQSTNDPPDYQWESFRDYLSAELERYAGGGVPSRW